jgi:glutaredoxin-like YruB-family protein
MKHVTLYSYEECPYCQKTKAYLKEHNITYTNKDVHKDEKNADEMIKLTGQMAVPVLIAKEGEKEDVLIGYDEEALNKIFSSKQ